MRAGAPVRRASASASRASGTAAGASPANTWPPTAMVSSTEASARSPPSRAIRAACSAKSAASASAPRVLAMFDRAAQTVASTRQSGVSRRALASAAWRHSASAPVTSARFEANTALTAKASG